METVPTLEDDRWSPRPPSASDGGDETAAAASAIDAVDRLLDGVEQALVRLDDGTYGTCPGCGEPVNDDRLAARPTVVECSACASDVCGHPESLALHDRVAEAVDPAGGQGPAGD
jgi:RNA polymerase-binding transcription factor DksA